MSFAHAQDAVESWRRDYNEARPHSGLAGRTPTEFARELEKNDNSPQRLTA
jgi:putative transposase